MKKIIFLLSLIFLILPLTNSYGYGGCFSYGMAIENYNGTCSCMKGYRWGVLGGQDYCISGSSYCYNNFGINSEYDYLSDSCKCRSGYGVSYDFLGNKTCISNDTLCQNDYGYGAKSTGDGYCGCKSGYIMGKNSLGKKQCNSGYTYCSNTYGYNAQFNSITNSCECKTGYIIKTDSFGNQSCEEKSNSAYFFLSEYDDNDNKALVMSYVTKKKYLLELRFTSGLYKAEDFVGKSIVINMGTDFSIDKYDKFILNNETKITDVVSDILSVEEVDDDFKLKTCSDVYGENSEETSNNKCSCKSGFQWNYNQTSCELIPIKTNTCFDTINGFLGTDGKCYCNVGYSFDNNSLKCIKNYVPSKNIISTINPNIEKANNIFNNLNKKIANLSNEKKINFYEKMLQKISNISDKLDLVNKDIFYHLYLKIDSEKQSLLSK